MKTKIFKLALFIAGYALVLATTALAQTTNVIPSNLYLTDDGRVFWYRHGQRLADVKKIKEAQNSPESRPADMDSDGNWGATTNGLQLSLRFDKRSFTNGELIIATVLVRNVTNAPVKFFRSHISRQPSPVNLLVFKNGEMISRKESGGIMEASGTEVDIFPQTQLRFNMKINDYYGLTTEGEFLIQAVYDKDAEISSQKVPIKIEN